MPLQQLQFRPGVNREGTTLANEGGWFESQWVRFKSGYPQKIGGWVLLSSSTFIGTCRSLWNWVTLRGFNLLGLGTESKFYVEYGGEYKDITPLRSTVTLTDPFTTNTNLGTENIVTVNDTNHGAINGDYVTFSGVVSSIGGIPSTDFNREFVISYVDANTYTITTVNPATSVATGGGTVVAAYQINVGNAVASEQTGWGTGFWGGVTTGARITTLGADTLNTTLTTAITSSTSIGTINVVDTTGFAASGTIVIGSETLTYSAKTGTTFTITARGEDPGSYYPVGQVVAANNVTITVGSTAGFSDTGGLILIDNELITYTSTNTPTNTQFQGCLRGASGTVAAAHTTGAIVTNASDFSGWGESRSQNVDSNIRLWSQSNFGEDLLFNPRGGGLYLWQPGNGPTPATSTRGVLIGSFIGTANIASDTTLTVTAVESGVIQVGMYIEGTNIPDDTYIVSIDSGTGGIGTYTLSAATTATTSGVSIIGVSDVPSTINQIMVSDSSRIVIAFGCNDYLISNDPVTLDPLLVRWTAQESYLDWTPTATNQAGSYRLSHGSRIIGAIQTRQEILVWTDAAIYAMQYLGPPYVWGFTLLADNISMASPNCMATANGVVYWMGVDKFYVYSGRVETLPSSLRSYVYNDINRDQFSQIFAGTNEGFSEIWWYYCSANSNAIDKYVVFNYLDRVWYYGSLPRTAWLDSPLRATPMAATYDNTIVYHEQGNDDGTTNPPSAIPSYIQSSDFDIGDGHNYGFVWRMIPDITFDGSTTPSPLFPNVTFAMRPRQNPGSNYGSAPTPLVSSTQTYSREVQTYNVQQFTEIIFTRVRGRQLAFKISSSDIGVQWQLGVPRMDVRPDGRR